MSYFGNYGSLEDEMEVLVPIWEKEFEEEMLAREKDLELELETEKWLGLI